MIDFQSVLNLQVEALLEALRGEQEKRCRTLIVAAESRARDLVGQSRLKLRARIRQAVDEERKRRATALRQTRHRIRAAQSRKVQALYERVLRQAWQPLSTQLERRWADTADRRAWAGKLIDQAENTLGSGAWIIEHPEAWSAKDSRWLTQILQGRGIPEPTYRADPATVAGLRIRMDTACLDGTIDGLLAHRNRVEGLLLAAWERRAREYARQRDG